ncbi:MAG: hypothetical protein ACOYOP_11740 [Microthrixaceae bacterium]
MSDVRTLEPPDAHVHGGTRRGLEPDGRRFVSKTATGARRGVLRREAEVLAALRGHGVVQLIRCHEGEDHTEVRTLDAGRSTLAGEEDRESRRRRATLAAAAAALAAIHGRGWSHGAVTLEHAVVDPAGEVRWCSLGSASNSGDVHGAIESDRRALLAAAVQLSAGIKGGRRLRRDLLALGPCPSPEVIARTVRPQDDRSRQRGYRPRRAPAARRVPHIRIPEWTGGGRAWPRMAAAGVAVAVTVLVGVATLTRPPRAPVPEFGAVRTATTDRGPGPTVVLDGVILGVGRAGDAATVADPGCRGRPTVLLLRPATGEVFAFPSPPEDRTPIAGRPVARVPGAMEWSPAGPCGPPSLRRSDGTTYRVEVR